MAVCAHDQEIGIELGHLGQYRVGNRHRGEIVPNDLRSGVQPVPPEMSDQVLGEFDIGEFVVRIDQAGR